MIPPEIIEKIKAEYSVPIDTEGLHPENYEEYARAEDQKAAAIWGYELAMKELYTESDMYKSFWKGLITGTDVEAEIAFKEWLQWYNNKQKSQ